MKRWNFLANLLVGVVAFVTFGRVRLRPDYEFIDGVYCYRGSPVKLKKRIGPLVWTDEVEERLQEGKL